MLDKEFYEKWNERDKDSDGIAECIQCEKPYRHDIFNNSEPNPYRYELQVCRECFYDINKKRTPEIELLFKLIDKKTELAAVKTEVENVFNKMIEDNKTSARIELDEFQKTAGINWFGPQPRPENFKGDPPLSEPKFEVLFGLDPVTGNIAAPTIHINDGTN